MYTIMCMNFNKIKKNICNISDYMPTVKRTLLVYQYKVL